MLMNTYDSVCEIIMLNIAAALYNLLCLIFCFVFFPLEGLWGDEGLKCVTSTLSACIVP